MTCKFCGCNLDIEAEMFGSDKLWTGHSCRGSEEADQKMVLKVLGVLRTHGVPCFLSTDVIPNELADLIKGEG